jgi:hypothetical protein
MAGMLSLFATDATVFTASALANTTLALLSFWWLGVVLLAIRDRTDPA